MTRRNETEKVHLKNLKLEFFRAEPARLRVLYD